MTVRLNTPDIDLHRFVSYQHSLTVESAVSGLKIAHEVRTHGAGAVKKALGRIQKITEESLSIAGNSIQSLVIAEYILSNHPYLTMDEIIYIYGRGSTGVWGEHYGRLNLATVSGWVRSYEAQDRAGYLERHHSRHKSDHRRPLVETPPDKQQEENKYLDTLIKLYKEALGGYKPDYSEQNVKINTRFTVSDFLDIVKKESKRADDEILEVWLAEFERLKYQPGVDYINLVKHGKRKTKRRKKTTKNSGGQNTPEF